ncbi:hypothetical protein LguiB_031134 [Lonicera macranthoides]
MKSQEVPKRQSGALLCPFQRHISPMLDLGTALHTKGFFITVAHTMFNSPDTSNHPDFTFLPLADNLSEHDTSPGNLLALMKTINNSLCTKWIHFPPLALLKEDSNCIPRLNKQAPNSVIYVSLRSLATMDQKELSEMAWGLANQYCGWFDPTPCVIQNGSSSCQKVSKRQPERGFA